MDNKLEISRGQKMKIFEVREEEGKWFYEAKPDITHDEIVMLLGIIEKAKHHLIDALDK